MLRNMGERGGIVVYATNLLKKLFTMDLANDYTLMYRFRDDAGKLGKYDNVKEIVLPAPNKFWWDQITVPWFARRAGLDLIYNPKLSIPILTRCRTVWVMHGGAQFVVPQVFKRLDRIYFSIANRLYAKRADAIITMTQLGANDIIQLMGAAPKKTHVIHESYNEYCRVLNPSELEVVKRKYKLPEKFILFVGGISPLKNFGRLLQAYQEIKPRISHKLVAVGFHRWKYSKDLALIEKLGLQSDVVFPGFVEDHEIPAFYNLAELFVLPSIYEGFGIPALEAMACGCPVVASRTGCSREVAGDAAILVDPLNPHDIASAIKETLSNPMIRKRLIECGLKRCKEFNWEKCARETLTIFQKLAPKEPVLIEATSSLHSDTQVG